MKTIASLAFGLACAVGASLGVASVTSLVVKGSERSQVLTMEASDLWTSTPIKIDRTTQTFERISPVLSTYASAPVQAAGSMPGPEQKVVVSLPAADEHPGLSGDHLSWCASRYRSFDPSTNSYRSFSGEIRTCSSPFETSASISSHSRDGYAQLQSAPQQLAAWCASRYRSYRPSDNTYQPHSGQRRVCQGPKAGGEIALR